MSAALGGAGCATVASAAPSGFGNLPTGVAPGGGPTYNGSLTSIVAPGALVTGGQVTVKLRSRLSPRSLRVLLNGRPIGAHLRRVGGLYTAALAVGGPLRQGQNLLAVSTGAGRQFDFDAINFVLARPASGIVSVQQLKTGQPSAPVSVLGRVARGATLQASVNGRNALGGFINTGGRLNGLLGAGDGVRPGANKLVLSAYTASGGQARVTTITRTFQLPKFSPVASAGPDQIAFQGQFVRLNGTRSALAGGDRGRSYQWQVVQAPRGSTARILDSTSPRPTFSPDLTGTYRLRLTLRTNPPASARRGGVLPTAARQSSDVITLTAAPSNPYGIPLESNGVQGEITRGGQPAPNTRRPIPQGLTYAAGISWAIYNRENPDEVRVSGQEPVSRDALIRLTNLAKQYSDGNSLMVFNWAGAMEPFRNELAALVKQVGGGELPAADKFTRSNLPGSVIGVPGAPAGSAYLDHRDVANLPDKGDMIGYLRWNDVTERFDFVFASYIPVDTAPSAKTTSTTSAVTVGSTDYTYTHPADQAGFQVVTLDPKTLALITNRGYVTNAATGASTADVARLANDLQFSSVQPEAPLVILQSFGKPKGTSADWDRAALAIEKMGGTRQVFDDLNQPFAGGVGTDPTKGRTGGYAFIGRTGSSAPRTEVSYPLDGLPARLVGDLMLSRTADYEPLMVGAPKPDGSAAVNTQLIQIANQAPTPWPSLDPDAGVTPAQIQAAENFLGGPAVMGVCPAGTCNVRQTYYTNYNGSWQTIALALQNAVGKCQTPPAGVDAAVCEKVRGNLFDEVQMGNRVRHYLGPAGLQQPFGAAGVAALANLGQIADEIAKSFNPPPADNTASKVLTIISYVVRVGSLAGPQASAVASGIGAIFGLAGYLTKKDNGSNLVGPEVQSTAAKLGVELAGRYQAAGDQLDGIGKIIVSDYGKLTAVAGKVDSDPNWIIGSPGGARENLVRAAKQTIAEVLIPKAYPVMYDLGRVYRLNAREWNCYYVVFVTKRKFLFEDEPDGGQVVERFPTNNWTPVIAVGAVHATGSTGGARIPSPPAPVADPLFAPVALGGLGLQKLEFYTPRLFRYFRDNPRKGDSRFAWDAENVSSPNCTRLPDPPGNSG